MYYCIYIYKRFEVQFEYNHVKTIQKNTHRISDTSEKSQDAKQIRNITICFQEESKIPHCLFGVKTLKTSTPMIPQKTSTIEFLIP